VIRRPPRSTPLYSSAASDVYKRQDWGYPQGCQKHFDSGVARSCRLKSRDQTPLAIIFAVVANSTVNHSKSMRHLDPVTRMR